MRKKLFAYATIILIVIALILIFYSMRVYNFQLKELIPNYKELNAIARHASLPYQLTALAILIILWVALTIEAFRSDKYKTK